MITKDLLTMEHGELLQLSGYTLFGWANSVNPNEPCWVEILGDGEVLQIIRANFDLGNQFELLTERQRKCGFFVTLDINTVLRIGRLEARLANTNFRLTGTLFPHLEQPKNTHHIGQVENHGGLKIWGWAWNPQASQTTQEIIVCYNGSDLARIKADMYRSDLAEQGIGNGRHGFEWTLPLSFANGIHQIEIFDITGQALSGSPLHVFSPEQGVAHWGNQLNISKQDGFLLDKLIERYQRYVPLSLGFDAYQEWVVRFGQSPELPLLNQKILIVIDGTGNLDVTLKSLYQQNHTNWIALVCGRMTDLLYHDDDRIQSVIATNWYQVLQEQLRLFEIVGYVISGDYLADNALTTALHAFTDPDTQAVYSDSDMPDTHYGRKPWLKPDWDIDLFLHTSALQDCFMTRSHHLIGFDENLLQDCSAWSAVVLTNLGERSAKSICHLPYVLYHKSTITDWQATSTHTAIWLESHAPDVKIDLSSNTIRRIEWTNSKESSLVSFIIPTRDHCDLLKSCIESLRITNYPNLEYIVIDNDSVESDTLAYFDVLKSEGVRVLKYSGTFNFSAMNNRAVEVAQGELIALINNDIEVLESDWLNEMVRQLLRPNVGAVGAKLLWANNFVQHGGVLLGQHGLAGHIGNDWHSNDSGYFGMNQRVRGVSAVTAACLLCRREDYIAVGGLNEIELPVNFNDVDFCLRLGKLGKRILWTPHARLRHLESASRGKDLLPEQQARFEREKRYMRKNWTAVFTHDPFYNCNLNLDRYSHAGLAIPPRHSLRS